MFVFCGPRFKGLFINGKIWENPAGRVPEIYSNHIGCNYQLQYVEQRLGVHSRHCLDVS